MFKKTLTLLLVFSSPLYAQNQTTPQQPAPDPVSFGNGVERYKTSSQEVLPDKPSEKLGPEVLTETDLLAKPETLVYLINRAVINKQWDLLTDLLAVYRRSEQPDQNLIRHAEGALLRKQGQVGEAVKRYRSLLEEQPELDYVKLDLGLMLVEDKQYKEAEEVLSSLKDSDLPPRAKNMAAAYSKALDKVQAWQPDFSLHYERTDNVNNASNERVIEWQGKRWTKNAESLPQSAEGFRYGAGFKRDKNIGGNHFVHANLSGDGVFYWDNHDYDEQSLRLSSGYKNQNANRSWGVIPFVEKNWLGGSSYSRLHGAGWEYGYKVSPRLNIALNASRTERHYDKEETAKRYNGFSNALGTTATYRVDCSWTVFGGLDYQVDNNRDASVSSDRRGVRIGTVKNFDNGLGTRVNLRYTRRIFDAPEPVVYRYIRKDHEYQVQASVWHRKLAWQGIMPRLNFRYLNIDSNMPGFYSRSSAQWFVSVEKAF
ncbi:surface lipoprotein assembly modifier [Neisseria sp. S1]|uniref:surface lipoprotein assembly modifier n=1 Tax=Neisseria sp. S1 TaxID=3318354 RepID=UPI003A83EDE5